LAAFGVGDIFGFDLYVRVVIVAAVSGGEVDLGLAEYCGIAITFEDDVDYETLITFFVEKPNIDILLLVDYLVEECTQGCL
jgi:hypothetical protein